MPLRPISVVLTCEHGGNRVPAKFKQLFAPHQTLLESHRGFDPGTKQFAQQWQKVLQCDLFIAEVTRLLVDLNRSPNHRSVFSEVTRPLPNPMRQLLLTEYHTPHRTIVTRAISNKISAGYRVLHIGVHSFTPSLNGEVRNADIGLLYDPRRRWERELCRQWQAALSEQSELRVRLNYPYCGRSDGLTTTLRKQFTEANYAGIELEINQRFPLAKGPEWAQLRQACIQAISFP